MSGNAFAILAKLGEKKKNVVVDTTTSSKPVKDEKKEAAKKEAKAAAKAAAPKTNAAPAKAAAKPTTGAKTTTAAAPAKKGEALGAKVGGLSTMAKLAEVNKQQAAKDAVTDATKAEKDAKNATYLAEKAAKKAEFEAEKKAEEQKKYDAMTEEEKAAADKEAAFQAKKQAEKAEEDNTPKVSMKTYEKEQNAKRFALDAKNARVVDTSATKGLKTLEGNNDIVIQIEKKAAKTPNTKPASGKKGAVVVEKKTAPKAKKAEAISFQDLAAKNGNYGARRQQQSAPARGGGDRPQGGRGGDRQSAPKSTGADAPTQALPSDNAFPDLA